MQSVGTIQSIVEAFSNGGIWMWAIFVAQIFSVTIIVERIVRLYVARKTNQTDIMNTFESDLKGGNLEKVIQKVNSQDRKTPIGKVIQAGAQAAIDLGGREEIQAQMDEVLLSENAKLRTRTGLLAMLGNTGTLLGLLGTIVGLIQAFASVAGVDQVEKAAMLTQGIAMAMNTTAYGLIMAIPALVAFGLLQSRTHTLSEDLNQAALKAFNLLSFKNESSPKRKARVRTEA